MASKLAQLITGAWILQRAVRAFANNPAISRNHG